MTAAVEASGLGKQYGKTWALRDCTLSLPEGRVAALIGPNGAGKSTFLSLVMGLTGPTQGVVTVDGLPAGSGAALSRVAFMGQDHPLYKRFSVADHLRLGQSLNVKFDAPWARARLDDLGIPTSRPAGKLSGGQQAQLALTLALAKRARVLLLDEPVASLDPMTRRDFMRALFVDRDADAAAPPVAPTMIISSHLLGDLERVASHIAFLREGRLQLFDSWDAILEHYRLLPLAAAESFGAAVVFRNRVQCLVDSRRAPQAADTGHIGSLDALFLVLNS